MTIEKCLICGSEARLCFKKKVLFKYDVSYFRCPACGFLFTEKPYWLAEAYQEDLKGIRDIGMVERNLRAADLTARLITKHLDARKKFVDFGAGTGLFVRLMRDRGFDYYFDDPLSRNIFARCFEAKTLGLGQGEYELLTAFEVFEHSPDPVGDVLLMLAFSDSILFSTELQPADANALEDWFYLLPEAGQHVAFHTPDSLRALAGQFDLKVFSNAESLHFFTKRPVKLAAYDLDIWHRDPATKVMGWLIRKLSALTGAPPPMPSLISADVKRVNQLMRERVQAKPRAL